MADNMSVWFVVSSPYRMIVGAYDTLDLAKQAVEELHRNSVWHDRDLEWDDTTHPYEISAHPVFPDDWDEERIATICRVQVNKTYTEPPFGERIEGSHA